MLSSRMLFRHGSGRGTICASRLLQMHVSLSVRTAALALRPASASSVRFMSSNGNPKQPLSWINPANVPKVAPGELYEGVFADSWYRARAWPNTRRT